MMNGMETLAAAATAVATMNDKSYYFYQGKESIFNFKTNLRFYCF